MPVRWVNDPKSKVTLLRHPAQMLADLWRIRRAFKRSPHINMNR
jgi:ornithine carbamoyltransferase